MKLSKPLHKLIGTSPLEFSLHLPNYGEESSCQFDSSSLTRPWRLA